MNMNQKGFAGVVVVIIAVLALSAVVLFVVLQNATQSPTPSENQGSAFEEELQSSPPSTRAANGVPLTAGLVNPKGMDPFAAQDFLTKNGMNLFAFAQDWKDIEPSRGKYNLKDTVTNPLTLLVPKHQFDGVLVAIKMIDTNVRTMPSDLEDRDFDDPEVRSRFLAMLHAVAKSPGADKLTHILLGNEVDAYFSAHPKELPAFMTLLKESIDQLHRDLPGVQVGTITTFDALNNPALFEALIQYSDFVDYTYYPINGLSGGNVAKGWQMRPLSEVQQDLKRMANGTSKPFGFTEIGYSSSPINGASEDAQAEFVKTVFETLTPYKEQNRIAFISWSSFADYPPEFCRGYAGVQGIQASPEFCAFLNNLGLRTSEKNKAKKGWGVFVEEVSKW